MSAHISLHHGDKAPAAVRDHRPGPTSFLILELTGGPDVSVAVYFDTKTALLAWLAATVATVRCLPDDVAAEAVPV